MQNVLMIEVQIGKKLWKGLQCLKSASTGSQTASPAISCTLLGQTAMKTNM